MDKKRMMRFVGIVCWFLALFMIMSDAKEQKMMEEQQQEQTVVMQEVPEEPMEDGVSTVVLPSKK